MVSSGLWRLQRETLPAATIVLDWWHIAMRFEHALQAARGLTDTHLSNEGPWPGVCEVAPVARSLDRVSAQARGPLPLDEAQAPARGRRH